MSDERNVFGEPLQACSHDPLTGFFRNGSCFAGPDRDARHLVCCEMTADFLQFSLARGNDLITPHPEWAFPGLKPGDRWCVHAERWLEAHRAGKAPRLALLATHEAMLARIDLATLKTYALDLA